MTAGQVAYLVALGMVAAWRGAAAQAGGWTVTPSQPSVGDTVWLARQVTVPAGWSVRAGKLEPADGMEPLGDPAVLRAPTGWVTRYAVALFETGPHDIALPPVWRLAPNGRTDSISGGVVRVSVRSVIPDSVRQPRPRSFIDPLRPGRRRPLVALLGIVVSAGLLAGGIAWRRRPLRVRTSDLRVPVEREVPDARWLAAGEPKAVSARAAGRLRAAVAHKFPRASLALSTAECLAVLERALPDITFRQLADVLQQLDRVGFGAALGADVTALAERARTLTRELGS